MDLTQSTFSFGDHAYRRFVERIKDAVDPNGILSPGKQGIWPAAYRTAPADRKGASFVPIEFGIFDHVEAKGDRPVEQIYEERIATLKRAEEGGFHAFHLAEHHGHTAVDRADRGGLPRRPRARDNSP